MGTPFLATKAHPVEGIVVGHTLITATEPETTDDDRGRLEFDDGATEPSPPFLARGASLAAGEVRGHTIVTRAIETSDDPSH